MTDTRDKAADAFFDVGLIANCKDSYESDSYLKLQKNLEQRPAFIAGWDACAKQQFVDATKEAMKNGTGLLGRLSMENERLKADRDRISKSHDLHFDAMMYNGDQATKWREQAEKLAVALEFYERIGRECETGELVVDEGKAAIEALAEFEALKKAIINTSR